MPPKSPAPHERCRRSNLTDDAQAAFRDAATAAPRDAAINAAWGEFFFERQCQTCNTEAVKSFQMALEQDPRYVPAMFGLARAVANDNPPAAIGMARKILEVNPSHVETHVFLAGQAADAGKRDEARQLIQKALVGQPVEPRGALAARGARLRRRQDPGIRSRGRQGPGDVVGTRRGLSRRRRVHGACLSLRRSGGAGAARAGHCPRYQQALAELGMYLLRTGDEGGARNALESSFKLNPYDVVTYNLLEMMDTLDTFVTTEDGETSCCVSTRPTPPCFRRRRWRWRDAPWTR